MATDVTESTFAQEVIEGSRETPILVDFWAEWCGPCHAVSPVLEKIVAEREGQLKLVKINIDENQNLAGRFGVMSIPMMILFKDGEPVAATVGARSAGSCTRLSTRIPWTKTTAPPSQPPTVRSAKPISVRISPSASRLPALN